MIQYIRSLFRWNGSAASRKVVGKQASVDIKDIPYIQDSNNRLNLLHNLYNRYKGTSHAPKLKAVYEQTKKIHTYLIAKRRVRELELFHIQNTDNFINTFTAILEAYQRNQDNTTDSRKSGVGKEAGLNAENVPERIKVNPEPAARTLTDEIPQLAATAISINTFTKITYKRIDATGNTVAIEIGSTSTNQEKETFIATISSRLGVYKLDISYVGNTQVNILNSNSSIQMEILPVVNWRGCLYVFSLNDYRLFPVRINRKQAV